MKNDKFTLQDWELLEAEKNEQLRKIKADIEALNGKRPEILLCLAEGDQSAFDELKNREASIANLKIEAESIETFLRVIPGRKDYARGMVVEAWISQIKTMDAELPALAADVNKKVEALILSVKKLYDFLTKFDELGAATRNLNLSGSLLDTSKITRHTPGIFSGGTRTWDIGMLLAGAVADKETFSAWLGEARKSIADRLAVLRDHARRLKGENLPDRPAYCPNCYERNRLGLSQKDGNSRCFACGKMF